MNIYETDRLLAEYLLFHYGTAEEVLPYGFGPHEALGYPIRCVSECLDAERLPEGARALDLGCAVGRSAFELARYCDEVIGIDYSARFIEAAKKLQAGEVIEYRRVDEGRLGTLCRAAAPANHREVLLEAFNNAVLTAARKVVGPARDLRVEIDPESGKIKAYAKRTVVETVRNKYDEISVAVAKKFKEDAQIGEDLEVPVTPKDFQRIAAQTAKQAMMQRIEQAEKERDFERGRVKFEVGDAMDLRANLGQFDVVLMANLIDRLSEPQRCLARLSELVKPGGQLIVTSPYTWLEEFTPREKWLGGFESDGRSVSTLDGLRAALAPAFEFIGSKDLPFLIREHARKYQWSVAQATLWRRL